jgi:hypothetical protein
MDIIEANRKSFAMEESIKALQISQIPDTSDHASGNFFFSIGLMLYLFNVGDQVKQGP